MTPPPTGPALRDAWKSFWEAMIEQVPGEGERSKQATGHSFRWRHVPTVDRLVISMFLDDKWVGIFVRDEEDEQNVSMRRYLEPNAERLRGALRAPLIEKDPRFLFVKRENGDFTDPAQQVHLIKWLAQERERYETTLRQILGDGKSDDDEAFGEDA